MEKAKEISRRQFILGSAGAATLTAGVGVLIPPGAAQAASLELPLPFYKGVDTPVLDPETVREYAFNHYFNGGCMHGAASGLMQAFKEAFAEQDTGWDLLPYGMYQYGAGGVAGWGTLCGILNGCMAIANLIGVHGLIGNNLMGWYSTTLFPTANCEGYIAVTGQTAIPHEEVKAFTVSDSPLCHISISKWCQAAGVNLTDTTEEGLSYKNDRCSKVCADTAAKTAELINEIAAQGTLSNSFTTPEPYASCIECHGDLKDQVGKMDCLSCHSPSDAVMVGHRHPTPRSMRK